MFQMELLQLTQAECNDGTSSSTMSMLYYTVSVVSAVVAVISNK